MTLFDDTTAHNSESNSAVATEAEPTASEPTLIYQPEPNQAPAAASTQEAPHAAAASDEKPASEDFASALESFTTETEEAVGEDRVIKGTVLKLTSTHVVVDVGAKSEGMLPISEVLAISTIASLAPRDCNSLILSSATPLRASARTSAP